MIRTSSVAESLSDASTRTLVGTKSKGAESEKCPDSFVVMVRDFDDVSL